jgi:hypothetical protein
MILQCSAAGAGGLLCFLAATLYPILPLFLQGQIAFKTLPTAEWPRLFRQRRSREWR